MDMVLQSFMANIIRFRWSDVEEGSHPLANVMEASWDDKESYDIWMNELRSKGSQLFRFVAHYKPAMAASVIKVKIESLIALHGGGKMQDLVDPKTRRLLELSQANLDFEGIQCAFESILLGIPDWAMQEKSKVSTSNGKTLSQGQETRALVRSHLSELANAIINWTPSDVWLKFRRVGLLQGLRYFWVNEPATLASGIDALLIYISAVDEWDSSASQASFATSTSVDTMLSEEVIAVRKKAGMALISVSKRTPSLLLPWLGQLSERAISLLSSERILNPNRMHICEFLSVIATAIEQPKDRAKFISDVLSDAISVLESDIITKAVSSVDGFLTFLGVKDAGINHTTVTDANNVQTVTKNFARLFSAYNQLLSVGKRCLESTKFRPNGGIPFLNDSTPQVQLVSSSMYNFREINFPDEGPVSMQILTYDNPFIPLWTRILPPLLRTTDVILRLWHPEYQAQLFSNDLQRFLYAISDDEAYMAQKQDTTSNGGVFGESGTAGTVVSGWSRRDQNLVPRWSGWMNELRHTVFQLFGLMAADRVLYSPDFSGSFPGIVAVLANPVHLRSMEHRHLMQFWKQFVEYLCLGCPSTLYPSHLSPLLGPILEHMQYRLPLTWAPVLSNSTSNSTAPLTTSTCSSAAAVASRDMDSWYSSFYARGGLFVGDLDSITGEAAVEKCRVDMTRAFSDVIQSVLALKGDWGLVLANISKEDQAFKRNDPSRLSTGPRSAMILSDDQPRNADGTPRTINQPAIEARQLQRINKICHYMLLEDERIAGALVVSLVDCLSYPDAYTCRRTTRICHRILENVAWVESYTALLGQKMFTSAVKLLVTEPKWMVGIEWDMIALVRDIYCRLVLGQYLLPGGQGAGMQQPRDPNNPLIFEQSKNVALPLQGGGILVKPSELPQQILSQLPGISAQDVLALNKRLREKMNAKDQKDNIRELLRVGAEALKQQGVDQVGGVFQRAVTEESMLSQKRVTPTVPDLPEKLITVTQARKDELKGFMNSPDTNLSNGNTLNTLYG